MTRRRLLLAVPLLLAGAAVCAVAVLQAHRSRSTRSSASPDGVYLGVYADYNEAMRAALRQVSSDAAHNPRGNLFVARWSRSRLAWIHLDEEMDQLGLEYDRGEHRLTQWDGNGSGGYAGVSVEMLGAAARTRDPFGAFGRYGCRAFP